MDLEKSIMRSVTHKLFTPLTSIFGMLQSLKGILGLMEKSAPVEDIEKNLKVIEVCCYKIKNSMKDYVDFLNLQNNNFELNVSSFDLKELI
jgi:K+-sensing histidine kinase KdpD